VILNFIDPTAATSSQRKKFAGGQLVEDSSAAQLSQISAASSTVFQRKQRTVEMDDDTRIDIIQLLKERIEKTIS